MKLSLRAMDSVVILHIQGPVTTRDVDILMVGARRVMLDHLPFILDFENSQFDQGVKGYLEKILKEFRGDDAAFYIVSKVVELADTDTFEHALEIAGINDHELIVEIIKLEDNLTKLERVEEALKVKAGGDLGQNEQHQSLIIENEKWKYLVKLAKENISKDTVLYQKFIAKVTKGSEDQTELKKIKKEVLLFMESNSVYLARDQK